MRGKKPGPWRFYIVYLKDDSTDDGANPDDPDYYVIRLSRKKRRIGSKLQGGEVIREIKIPRSTGAEVGVQRFVRHFIAMTSAMNDGGRQMLEELATLIWCDCLVMKKPSP
jgi:hypothetical protein